LEPPRSKLLFATDKCPAGIVVGMGKPDEAVSVPSLLI
jgi:hypothetical protein